jgi:aspartate aminotransferase-like enzyme
MPNNPALPAARDALLFTPGPLTTSLSVKEAMLHDAGSWHGDFNAVVASVREQLLALAFAQALRELEAEGGVAARHARYRLNHTTLIAGMARLGFRTFLHPSVQSPIITAFHYPTPTFDFPGLYRALSERGLIIYPGKLTQVATFRIGTIGRLLPADLDQLVSAIETVLRAPTFSGAAV